MPRKSGDSVIQPGDAFELKFADNKVSHIWVVLAVCPFNSDAQDGSAIIVRFTTDSAGADHTCLVGKDEFTPLEYKSCVDYPNMRSESVVVLLANAKMTRKGKLDCRTLAKNRNGVHRSDEVDKKFRSLVPEQ